MEPNLNYLSPFAQLAFLELNNVLFQLLKDLLKLAFAKQGLRPLHFSGQPKRWLVLNINHIVQRKDSFEYCSVPNYSKYEYIQWQWF